MADETDDDGPTPAVRDAAQVLYGGSPDAFLDARKDLSARAKAGGDPAAAKAIGALRKPTVAAAVVNRYVVEEPETVDRLLDIGSRLRDAHEALDAATLRELSAERRSLVGELTTAALDRFGPGTPSAGQRDEVANTFDAAVADPEIAGRLGRLTRSESWSGFGVAPLTGPALTLVRGGRDRTSTRTAGRGRPRRRRPSRGAVGPTAARRTSALHRRDAQGQTGRGQGPHRVRGGGRGAAVRRAGRTRRKRPDPRDLGPAVGTAARTRAAQAGS